MMQFFGILCSAKQRSHSYDLSEVVKSICRPWDAQGLPALGITSIFTYFCALSVVILHELGNIIYSVSLFFSLQFHSYCTVTVLQLPKPEECFGFTGLRNVTFFHLNCLPA